ncbi:unnamed protein product [Paramecium primaurelia]|uniref:Uncharacterized protein n=1 Tax=Paramecium primaurelia TaxID=5886 RepID=A0A8S1PJD1_PARPR|nr:unnamed protein product [Paramecium primaurelia]
MLNNGGIAGVAGSFIVDLLIDGPEELLINGQSTLLGCIPYVGIGFSAIKFISRVYVSDFLSESEKVYHCTLMAIKSGGTIGLGCLGYQGGAALGSLAGPAGIIFGGVIGGMIGGATGNLLGRAIDNSTQFSLQVDFSKENKSIVKNGYLINPGKRPHIRWAHVKDMVNSLILIGQTEKQLTCVIPNISRNLTAIDPDQDIGIELIQYKYLGPDDSSQKITFRLLATTHDNINDSEVLEKLQLKQIQIIDIAEFEVNLKCM